MSAVEYGALVAALRRPAAGYADATTTMLPRVLPDAGLLRDWTWARWTVVDLLLLPVALWLAEGPGRHRRHRGDRRRRGITLRRPTRTRTASTGGTTR